MYTELQVDILEIVATGVHRFMELCSTDREIHARKRLYLQLFYRY